MEKTIKSIGELEEFAVNFLGDLRFNPHGATIVGLSGELGSGKTAFTKAVAKAIGVSETVLSPTFVIAKFYDIARGMSWSRLVHIDAYRIGDDNELKALRFEEILSDPKNLVFVEWPENICGAFPKNITVLTFRFIDETTRAIALTS